MNTDRDKPAVVLLVEDEVLVNIVASEALTEAGYRVIETYNAEEALEVLNLRGDVRALVTDVEMPGSPNGYTLARIVDMRWPGIGVVVTSGRALPGPGDLPKKASFLAKPYSPSALLDAVKAVLDTHSRSVPIHYTPKPQGAPVLPVGIKVDQLHTGIGPAGGLAQPLPEPEE